MKFIDAVLLGDAPLDSIYDYREAWDETGPESGAFHEYIGLLWPEYAMWVEDATVLECIVMARRANVLLSEYLKQRRGTDPRYDIYWDLCRRY